MLEPTLNRGDNLSYFLPRPNGSRLEVCKVLFMATLGISDKMIYNISKAVNGVQTSARRFPPVNKLGDAPKQSVIYHIISFSVVKSQYCR